MIAQKKYRVIIPTGLNPRPTLAEISAADLLARYFEADVHFIERSNYKTPDFLIKGEQWELKSLHGAGKRNIQHAVSKALKQSPYVIIDARASKLHIAKIRHRIQAEC